MSKKILGGLVLILSISSGNAQTVIDIAGASEIRSSVHNHIIDILDGETYAWNGGWSGAGTATRVIYKGLYKGESVIVRTYWGQSAKPYTDMARNRSMANAFLGIETTTESGGVEVGSGDIAPASSATVPEIVLFDIPNELMPGFAGYGLADIEDIISVVPYKYFKNAGAPERFTNVTVKQLWAFYQFEGELPLYMLTGDFSDQSAVFASGLMAGAGSRVASMAEYGVWIYNFVNLYGGIISSGVVSGIYYMGNNGYSSGGDLALLLGYDYSGGGIIGYLGPSDWDDAEGAGAVELSYNGTFLGSGQGFEERVGTGYYSFWNYLKQARMNHTQGITADFYSKLRDSLRKNPGSGLIPLRSMRVERASVGAPITPIDFPVLDEDGDGLSDDWELLYFDSLDQEPSGDFDSDGVTNHTEHLLGMNPSVADSDGDGLLDDWEIAFGLNPLSGLGAHGPDGDLDGDGVPNYRDSRPDDPIMMQVEVTITDPIDGSTINPASF